MEKERIILGIDPGTSVMGYGLLCERNGNKLELIALGVVQLKKYTDHPSKLKHIFEKVLGLIDNYHPDVMAIEAPFFGKNVQSMLKLGRAQGVAMAAGLYRDIPIFEYSPKKIKQSITGNGNASKEQVAAMLQSLLRFTETPEFLDATDGLAAAACHALQKVIPGTEQTTKKSSSPKGAYTGWAAFLKENPDRLK